MMNETTAQQEEWRQIQLAMLNLDDFAPLYQKYIRPIFNYCYHKIGHQEEAKDLAQQVFIKAMLNLKTFKNKGYGLGPWLYKIAYNEINDWFKQKNKEEVWLHQATLWEELGMVDPNQATIISDEILSKALSKIKPDALELIRLRYFEQMPFAMVAEVLSITESNAKVRMHRTISELKNHLSNLMKHEN